MIGSKVEIPAPIAKHSLLLDTKHR